ncbi:MAG: hypothetical protein MZW92_59740 [Comamonadaceae bacterium]|nr:hypothetical protein [Comamonadaceae bacterium]
MTEDARGLRRPEQHASRGWRTRYTLYKPKMIAVFDDLHGRGHRRRPERLHQERQGEGQRPGRTSTCRSRTRPAFVGTHVTGYDNALLGILQHFWDGKAGTSAGAAARARRRASTSSPASTASSSAT